MENRSEEITQNTDERHRNWKYKGLVTWSIERKSVPYIWSVPEENQVNKEAKNLFEEIIAENVPELRKNTKPWFKKPNTPPSRNLL